MYEDLILLLMGVVVAAMLMAVVLVQSRLSGSKPKVIEEPEEEKIYVEMGFEPEDELETDIPEPAMESTVEFDLESLEPAIELEEDLTTLEPEEVFIEAPEPVIIETPMIIVEDPEPEPEPEPEMEPMKPIFEASYEPSEPVVIESPEMVVIEVPKTVELATDKEAPLFDVLYEESKPVVIETESMILEPHEVVKSESEVDMNLAPMEERAREEEQFSEVIEDHEVIEFHVQEIEEELSGPEPLVEETIDPGESVVVDLSRGSVKIPHPA